MDCKTIGYSGHTCIYSQTHCAHHVPYITLKLVIMCSFKNAYVLNKLQYTIMLFSWYSMVDQATKIGWIFANYFYFKLNTLRVDSLHFLFKDCSFQVTIVLF